MSSPTGVNQGYSAAERAYKDIPTGVTTMLTADNFGVFLRAINGEVRSHVLAARENPDDWRNPFVHIIEVTHEEYLAVHSLLERFKNGLNKLEKEVRG